MTTQIKIETIATSNYKLEKKSIFNEERFINENKTKSFIFLKSGRSYKKVRYSEILYVKALGSYCLLSTQKSQFTISASLKSVLFQLSYRDIIKCHRSYAVNINAIDEFDESTITIRSEKKIIEVPVSLGERNRIMSHLPRIRSC